MNKAQRKFNPSTKRYDTLLKEKHTFSNELEELLPPKIKRNPFKTNKPMTNRCCFVSPDCKDAELTTDDTLSYVDDHFNALIRQQYEFDPAVPSAVKHLKELRKVLCGAPKVDNCSQYGNEKESYIKVQECSKWQSVDNVNDIEQYFVSDKENYASSQVSRNTNIRICETPHLKVIAEKFTKFKKNNVEVRKLEEKIVCMEYDVYKEFGSDIAEKRPYQKMRAYFSLKPNKDDGLKALPSTVKRNFNITDEELEKLNNTEIEMIDSKIEENKSYLGDLNQILRRNKLSNKKNSNLDLMMLYEMAKTDRYLNKQFTSNIMTEKDLQDVKKLIIQNDALSVHGLSKRTILHEKTEKCPNTNRISQSIIAELISNGRDK